MSTRSDAPRYVCVDSSVVFKWFCSEDESSLAEATALFEDHRRGRITLVAPAHLVAEVLDALNCRPGLTTAQVETAAEALAASEILFPAWNADMLTTAVRLARAHRLTVNDALFPALAAQAGCELVTADRAQARVTECAVRLLR